MATRFGTTALLAVALGLLSAAAQGATVSAEEFAVRLQQETRAAEDRARDAGRKPAEVVAFLASDRASYVNAQAVFVDADYGQIQQALSNILVNAIHAMPDGGDVSITVAYERAVPPAERHAAEGVMGVLQETFGERLKTGYLSLSVDLREMRNEVALTAHNIPGPLRT